MSLILVGGIAQEGILTVLRGSEAVIQRLAMVRNILGLSPIVEQAEQHVMPVEENGMQVNVQIQQQVQKLIVMSMVQQNM